MKTINYRCPACGADVAIEDHLFGETVTCPKCQAPFIVEPPRAYPQDDVGAAEASHSVVRQAADIEATLRTAHPVMFRRHPWRFLLEVALVAAGVWGLLRWWENGEQGTVLGWISAAALIVGAGALIGWRIQTLAATLTVTDKRTRFSRGLISRHATEVRHEDVRNLQIHQNIWGRVTNVGDLAISSSGQDDVEIRAHGLSSPDEIAELIRQRQ